VTIEVDAASYEEEVIRSNRPVLVDFWGPRCGPCLALAPQVERLAEQYVEELKVVKIDASKNRRLCMELKVLHLPTFLLYKGGEEIHRLTGDELTIQGIEASVRELLG
jgi:thioredoxin 1